MTQVQGVTVTRIAAQQARQCGLTGDVEARIAGLFLHSVPTVHPMGNRQYGPFVMLVQNWTVQAFTIIGPRDVTRRPVHACKLCQGLMILKTTTPDGTSARPCPRAADTALPLCDERPDS